MKRIIRKIVNRLGYDIIKTNKGIIPSDILIHKEFMEVYNFCKPYTMTSIERMYSLYLSVEYVLENNIPGDFVECGVWKGGSAMLMARCLKIKNRTDKKIYLYDTFEGMTKPEDIDVDNRNNEAITKFEDTSTSDDSSDWCYAGIDEVKHNMYSTDVDKKQFVFVKGKVEDSIPATIPTAISLLRLDTDWYQSTKHELEHLYPLITKDGVLIIDDFGHWEGCKKAVVEYFEKRKEGILLNRIDVAGRMVIKNFE